MSAFLWIGTALGALAGLCHAALVYRQQAAAPGGATGRGLYYSLWTVLLWTLFGAYLLAFWLLGLLGMGLSRLFRRGATPP